jgi:hypothetical protein
MKMIKNSVTQGVIALPLQKKSPPEIYEGGGGGTRNDERCIDWVARTIPG